MKNNIGFYKISTLLSVILAGLIIYVTFKIGPTFGGRVYQIGIALFVIIIILASRLFDKSKKLQEVEYLISSWPEAYDNKFDFEKIHKFYYEYGPNTLKEKDIYNIDDQTADDLNLDEVLKEISICSSTPGEQMLYYILRTPKTSKTDLEKRNEIVNLLNKDSSLRGHIQQILSDLGRQRKGEIFNLFNTNAIVNTGKVLLYNILAFSSVIALIAFIFFGSKNISMFLIIFTVYMFISMRSAAEIEYELSALQYLGNFIKAAKELSKIDNPILNEYISLIKEKVEPLAKIESKTRFIYTQSELDIFIETINALFLTRIRSYYSVINIIRENKQTLIELYSLVGTIEAYVSIASFRNRIPYYCLPEFVDIEDKTLSVENINHPLLEDGVPNSISITNQGIVLTGSNMSGKSTFMRTIAVNILLSQTIYTSYSNRYKASFFRVMSSLSLSDNILSGASYYLEECKSVLRILNSIEEEVPAFCIIDEIFKGTNPIERIAASKEILKYIMDRNALAIVATHDLELAESCNENYLRYYFCEDIDEEEGLVFDYQLKEGICNTGNAIKLLSFLGYPEDILSNSLKTISNKNL